MKKNIITILLTICITLSLSKRADAQGVSHATIYSADKHAFTVYLNNQQKNDKPLDNVRIINLPQLYYHLKIIFEDTSLATIDKKIWNLQDAGGNHVDATFEIVMNKKGEPNIVWRSQTVFPAYIQQQPTVVIQNTAPVGTTTVQQTTTTTTPSGGSGTSMTLYTPMGDISVNKGDNASTPVQQTTTTTVYSTPATTPVTTTGCAGTVMNETDFADALTSIGNRTTEESKLLMAKQITSGSCMSCAQVKQMLLQLTTEESRLDLAKYAYSHTIDQGNYYKIDDVFKDEKNIDDLNKAIIK